MDVKGELRESCGLKKQVVVEQLSLGQVTGFYRYKQVDTGRLLEGV